MLDVAVLVHDPFGVNGDPLFGKAESQIALTAELLGFPISVRRIHGPHLLSLRVEGTSCVPLPPHGKVWSGEKSN